MLINLLVDLIFLVLPAIPWLSIVVIVLYGPFPNWFWRGEKPIGFALVVGGVAFSAGFFGPMLLDPSAAQGPLLGLFITGPVGLLGGYAWGLARAVARSGRPTGAGRRTY
jgi:hypothetical protein